MITTFFFYNLFNIAVIVVVCNCYWVIHSLSLTSNGRLAERMLVKRKWHLGGMNHDKMNAAEFTTTSFSYIYTRIVDYQVHVLKKKMQSCYLSHVRWLFFDMLAINGTSDNQGRSLKQIFF